MSSVGYSTSHRSRRQSGYSNLYPQYGQAVTGGYTPSSDSRSASASQIRNQYYSAHGRPPTGYARSQASMANPTANMYARSHYSSNNNYSNGPNGYGPPPPSSNYRYPAAAWRGQLASQNLPPLQPPPPAEEEPWYKRKSIMIMLGIVIALIIFLPIYFIVIGREQKKSSPQNTSTQPGPFPTNSSPVSSTLVVCVITTNMRSVMVTVYR